MSNTAVFTAPPNEWSLVDTLSQIMDLHSQAQARLRVYFGTMTTPAADADYAIVTNHLLARLSSPTGKIRSFGLNRMVIARSKLL